MGGVEKVKKHAARTPVGEGGKAGGSLAKMGGRESGSKSRHSVWEGSKSKKNMQRERR